MSWNFRLLDRSHFFSEPWVEIVEVFYHDDGRLKGFTEPYINAETREGVITNLMRIIHDIEDKPVLKLSDFGLTPNDDPKEADFSYQFIASKETKAEEVKHESE